MLVQLRCHFTKGAARFRVEAVRGQQPRNALRVAAIWRDDQDAMAFCSYPMHEIHDLPSVASRRPYIVGYP